MLHIHFLHILYERVLAVQQVEIDTHHVVDVGTSLHLHVAGLAIYQGVAAGRVGYELYLVLGRSAADIIHAHAIHDDFLCGSILRHLLGV